jgi:hypothetical protein
MNQAQKLPNQGAKFNQRKYKETYQIMPSNMLATVKEDCAKTTNKIIWVQAYCPN